MDPAKEFELSVLTRQEPMNAVIDRGDSPVQQFYRGATVFVTGGSGFLGKQLIEKLFRSCDIKKLFVLIRSKKGKSIKERMESILNEPVYDLLREKKPNFADLIVPVEGDITELRLGISDKDWEQLTKEVSMIFHLAATIRFDEPLRVATIINVRGTRETLNLAKNCNNLKCFVHVSTAFTHATRVRVGAEVKEQFYPCPAPPHATIELVEGTEDKRLNDITNGLIQDWPNTYTFTKALAEELLRLEAGDTPVCIVRPPMVAPAYYEPSPGIGDNSIVFGPSGILLGVGLGALHVFNIETDKKLNYVPADIVNNTIIAAPWDAMQRRTTGDRDIQIYHVSSSKCGLTWDFIAKVIRDESYQQYCTPLAVWYCYGIETQNRLVAWFLRWILHYIPAYLVDFICRLVGYKVKDVPSVVGVFKKIDKVFLLFKYFFDNEWIFEDDNTAKMLTNMTPEDRAIYNCDTRSIDYTEYVKVLGIGVRKYILKDGLKDSLKAAKKQKWLFYANIIYLSVCACVMFYLLTVAYLFAQTIFTYVF